MPNEDEIRRSQPPVNPAIQELLANIPEFDPRRRQVEELQKRWMRMPPEPGRNHPYQEDRAT
jgi:hypothetical protein